MLAIRSIPAVVCAALIILACAATVLRASDSGAPGGFDPGELDGKADQDTEVLDGPPTAFEEGWVDPDNPDEVITLDGPPDPAVGAIADQQDRTQAEEAEARGRRGGSPF